MKILLKKAVLALTAATLLMAPASYAAHKRSLSAIKEFAIRGNGR